MGVNYEPHHNITVIKGRPDTLYGRALIEYKVPGTLRSKTKFNDALEEVQKNIRETADKTSENFSKYVGIVIDGELIAFTKFRRGGWLTDGPTEINPQTTQKFLEYLRGLARKPLHPDWLVQDFGPESQLARSSVQVLYSNLNSTRIPRVKVLYEEWRKTFNQVCGYDFQSPKLDIKALVQAYAIPDKKVDHAQLLFAIHTYYALVIKFLAAEIAVTYASKFFRSFLEELVMLDSQIMRKKLEELEGGGVFAELGIKNFLEGDFFSWYIDIWSNEIASVISQVTRKLADYEPATATLEPDEVRDLLKKLYQYLIPRKIRHDLGEFFTPDWLTDIALDQVGYDGDPDKRLLDPGCGSGTFLVLAIKRAREFASDKMLDRTETLEKIRNNIIGFDLNPLAVIASRTNYLIALGDLLRFRTGDIYIPVYLCDSISTSGDDTLFGKVYEVSTSVGKFRVPSSVVDEKIIDEVFTIADEAVSNHSKLDEFVTRLRNRFETIDEVSLDILKKTYRDLLQLELKGVNRIWTRVIKNAFAPMFVGRFDYVVGNPPWIGWDSLPEEYRKTATKLWIDYKLIPKAASASLGRTKKDVSMLFVTRSVDKYLTERGKLSFLIPFTLFRAQAGAGFRGFLASRTKIEVIHDMVDLHPFEGAVNRTALLVLEHGTTRFPIETVMWTRNKPGQLDISSTKEEVLKMTKRAKMGMEPIGNDTQSSWMMASSQAIKALRKALGQSAYKAHEGTVTDANSIYWINVLDKQGKRLLIENLHSIGRKKVSGTRQLIEPDLVRPLLRGRDVGKWLFETSAYILLPVDENGDTLSLKEMRSCYPDTLKFFTKYFNELVHRGGEPYKSQLEPWREKQFEIAEKVAPPFYTIFNAHAAITPYKVCWKYISGEISGKGDFTVAAVMKYHDKILGEAVPAADTKLIIVPCTSEEEAFFVAGVLNSSISRLIVKAYTVETAISTHVLKHIRVPKYMKTEQSHKEVCLLSKEAHKLARESNTKELEKVEQQLDSYVGKIFGMNKQELENIIASLAVLSHE